MLIYERFISGDSRVVAVYERYEDSPSAISHLQAFKAMYDEQFARMVERKRFMVFGTPTNDLKEILDGFGATYFGPLNGFSSGCRRGLPLSD